MAYALRLTDGIGHRNRPALRLAEEREALKLQCVHHSREIVDHIVEADGLDVAVGEAGSAFVIKHKLAMLRQVIKQARPDRTLEIGAKMGQPGGGANNRWPG